jgi:hypothetical protein
MEKRAVFIRRVEMHADGDLATGRQKGSEKKGERSSGSAPNDRSMQEGKIK